MPNSQLSMLMRLSQATGLQNLELIPHFDQCAKSIAEPREAAVIQI